MILGLAAQSSNYTQRKCAELLNDQFLDCLDVQSSDPQITPEEVRKAWIKADSPETNQEKESRVASIENYADIDC